eukprot:724207-Pelagomonas_calceolata.AAC.3
MTYTLRCTRGARKPSAQPSPGAPQAINQHYISCKRLMEPEMVGLYLTGKGYSHGSKRRATQQPLTNTFMPLSKQQHDPHKDFTKFVITAELYFWKLNISLDSFKKLGAVVLWAFTAHKDGCMFKDDLIQPFHTFWLNFPTQQHQQWIPEGQNPTPQRDDVNFFAF